MTKENNQPITPFCVDMIGENLTDDQITEMFNKCIQCGAEEYCSLVEVLKEKGKYQLFGVNDDNRTFSYDNLHCRIFRNNLIKFSALDEHLGLVKQIPVELPKWETELKPFCVEDNDYTEAMITALFSLAINAGAVNYEDSGDHFSGEYFGVDIRGYTYNCGACDFDNNTLSYEDAINYLTHIIQHKEEKAPTVTAKTSSDSLTEEVTTAEGNHPNKRPNALQEGVTELERVITDNVDEVCNSMFNKDVEEKLQSLNLSMFYSASTPKGKKQFTISTEFDDEYYVSDLSEFNELVEVLNVLKGFTKKEV